MKKVEGSGLSQSYTINLVKVKVARLFCVQRQKERGGLAITDNFCYCGNVYFVIPSATKVVGSSGTDSQLSVTQTITIYGSLTDGDIYSVQRRTFMES